MADLVDQIKNLVQSGAVRVSEHGYDELADDDLTAREIVEGASSGIGVEVYDTYTRCIGDRIPARSRAVGRDVHTEETVKRKKTKYVHEGRFVAEVDVEVLEDETEWSPYLTVEDSYRLDDVRDALRRNDLESAARYGRIYEMHPIGRE